MIFTKPPAEKFMGQDGRKVACLSWSELHTICGFPSYSPEWPDWENKKTSVQLGDAQIIAVLANLTEPKTFLEIGVSEGNLAHKILSRCASIRFHLGLDVPDTHTAPPAFAGNAFNRGYAAMTDGRFAVMVTPGGFDSVPTDMWAGYWDFVFVDADHGYASVKRDTERAEKMVKPGGVLAWHDYHPLCPGVYEYLNERAKDHDIINAATVAWEIMETQS